MDTNRVLMALMCNDYVIDACYSDASSGSFLIECSKNKIDYMCEVTEDNHVYVSQSTPHSLDIDDIFSEICEIS